MQVKQVILTQVRSTLTPQHRNFEKFHFRTAKKIKAKPSKNCNFSSQEIQGDRENHCRNDVQMPSQSISQIGFFQIPP